MRKSLEQVQFDVGKRRLENPKLKQEKLIMQTEQVIFEYGKLQLNFLAQNQQLQQMAQALAEANKKAAENTQDVATAEAKVDRLLKAILVHPPLSYEELSKLADEINAPAALSEPTPIDRKK